MESLKKMGIYIDLNNVECGLADYNCYGMSLDYSLLVSELSKGYRLSVLNVYDCTVKKDSTRAPLHRILEEAGMSLKLFAPHVFTDEYGKPVVHQKEVDTSITTDVSWDLALGVVDVAVIVSGDRDMRPALTSAAQHGSEVRIVAPKESLSDSYYESLEDCTLIEDMEVFLVAGKDREEVQFNIASFKVMQEAEAHE